jgi:hypothetical protein
MRDDRRAFSHKRPKSAGMVEVRMRVDDVPNGLVRNGLPDGVEHGQGAVVVLRRLEQDDVIVEFDGD